MRTTILALLSTLLPTAALACGPPVPDLEAKGFVGWTNDGRYLVYEFVRNIDEWESVWASGEFLGVVDTHQDDTTSYLISVEGGEEGSEEQEAELAQWRKSAGKSAYDAWLKDHPLQSGSTNQRCDNATATMEIIDLSGHGIDYTEAQGWTNSLEYKGQSDNILKLSVSAFDNTWVHAEVKGHLGNGWEPPSRAQVSWSPTCKHIAWMLDNYIRGDQIAVGVFEPSTPVLVKPAGPVIHVMAHKTATATVEPIINALSKAGYAPHVGPNALKDRTETVIYSWASARKTAVAMAKHIPGGATVEPITWSTPADIVVAAGTSVLR